MVRVITCQALCLLSFFVTCHLVYADLRIPPHAADVLFWRNSPTLTGSGSKLCAEPSRHLGMFHECSAIGGTFPAELATCNCVGCSKKTNFKCNSDNGIWYRSGGFTCTSDNSGCVVCPNWYEIRDLVCEDNQVIAGKTGATRKCICIHNCLDVTLTCSSRGGWDYTCKAPENQASSCVVCRGMKEPEDLVCEDNKVRPGRQGTTWTCRCKYTCRDVELTCDANGKWDYTCQACQAPPTTTTVKSLEFILLITMSCLFLITLITSIIFITLWCKTKKKYATFNEPDVDSFELHRSQVNASATSPSNNPHLTAALNAQEPTKRSPYPDPQGAYNPGTSRPAAPYPDPQGAYNPGTSRPAAPYPDPQGAYNPGTSRPAAPYPSARKTDSYVPPLPRRKNNLMQDDDNIYDDVGYE